MLKCEFALLVAAALYAFTKPSDAAGFFTIGVSPDAKDKGK